VRAGQPDRPYPLPVLGNPANRNRAVPLTYEQFRYGFANAVSEEEAHQLYEEFAVPTPGKPLFGILLGVVFLLSGINEAGLAALAPGGWKVWHYLVAGIFFLGALWGFIRPGQHLLRAGLGAGADPDLLRLL